MLLARHGWVEPRHVFNARPIDEIVRSDRGQASAMTRVLAALIVFVLRTADLSFDAPARG